MPMNGTLWTGRLTDGRSSRCFSVVPTSAYSVSTWPVGALSPQGDLHCPKHLFPNLRQLYYCIDEADDIAFMQEAFNIGGPVRSSFSLESESGEWEGPYPHLVLDYVQWIGHQLTSLTIDSTYPVETLLPHLPELVQLDMKRPLDESEASDTSSSDFSTSIDAGETDTHVLGRLTPTDDGTPFLCHKLRCLGWEHNTCFSEISLLKLLIQRARSPHSLGPLTQVIIFFNGTAQCDILPDCEQLCKDGLELKLVYNEMLKWDLIRTQLHPKGWFPVFREQEWGWQCVAKRILLETINALLFFVQTRPFNYQRS